MPEKFILEAFGTKVPDGDVTVKIDHVLSAHFRPFSESDRKNRAFQKKKSNPYMLRKLGISKKMHVINIKIEKEPKMKFFDFWAFRKKRQKLSHDKIIFHMLFRAFQNTPRIHFIFSKYLWTISYGL